MEGLHVPLFAGKPELEFLCPSAPRGPASSSQMLICEGGSRKPDPAKLPEQGLGEQSFSEAHPPVPLGYVLGTFLPGGLGQRCCAGAAPKWLS